MTARAPCVHCENPLCFNGSRVECWESMRENSVPVEDVLRALRADAFHQAQADRVHARHMARGVRK